MEVNLLDKMLNLFHSQKTAVTIVLQNKSRITGRIATFDSYVIVMENAKHEIIYRHAISSILPSGAEAHPQPVGQKTAPAKTVQKQAPKPARYPQQARSRPPRQEPKAASASDSGLNTGMKEGLLKWMQEQKAGK